MKQFLIYYPILYILVGCNTDVDLSVDNGIQTNNILCTTEACIGAYSGPEFVNKLDIAHQFSNQMANEVGRTLKTNYKKGTFLKVDLGKIKMTTKHMDNRGNVIYSINIPFVKVSDSCQACTAFDHRGGWGHKVPEKTIISTFKHKKKLEYKECSTPEGLQEFWIQWQHKHWQKNCD